MKRAEAERLRERMGAEHPDRETHSFILGERDGEWTVAKVALPARDSETAASASPTPAQLHDHEAGRPPGGAPPSSAGA